MRLIQKFSLEAGLLTPVVFSRLRQILRLASGLNRGKLMSGSPSDVR